MKTFPTVLHPWVRFKVHDPLDPYTPSLVHQEGCTISTRYLEICTCGLIAALRGFGDPKQAAAYYPGFLEDDAKHEDSLSTLSSWREYGP